MCERKCAEILSRGPSEEANVATMCLHSVDKYGHAKERMEKRNISTTGLVKSFLARGGVGGGKNILRSPQNVSGITEIISCHQWKQGCQDRETIWEGGM